MNKKILQTLLFLFLTVFATQAQAPFTWDNSTVYFVLTDRFEDGNPANNNSYGRGYDGNGNAYSPIVDPIGGFHGGDLQGLTNKINVGYFDDLGVNALWITAPIEQIHGWVSGGSSGDFQHYAYHGYYALDWTELDANMGTNNDLATLMSTARSHGIRVLFDVVMNHVGYNTAKDMQEFNFGCIDPAWQGWRPSNGENWGSVHNFIDYSNNCANWCNWWADEWVPAGLPCHAPEGGGDLLSSLAGLPDVVTEYTNTVSLAPVLQTKWDAAKEKRRS